MESLGQAMSGKKYSEPPEVRKIKRAVAEIIGQEPKISINSDTIAVTVSSAAAAGALRIEISKIEQKIDTGKRLVIRIG